MPGDGRITYRPPDLRKIKMTETVFDHEDIKISGFCGDKEVRLCHCLPVRPNGIDVVLLHGVHSFANLSPHNKFRHLAELLTEKGFTVWLVETSRASRRIEEGEDHSRWVDKAFAGKTFAQEQDEVFLAIKEVLRRNGEKPIWLWGFSLGGIIAASAAAQITLQNDAPAIDRLVVSGTGLHAYPEVEAEMLRMPVLSTLRETLSPDMLSRVKTNGVISFRGEYDEVFPEESCLEFIGGMELPEGKKTFLTIALADHSLNHRNGKTDKSVMKEMVDLLLKQAF